jgi:uncharacterized protein (TIGR03067 family)
LRIIPVSRQIIVAASLILVSFTPFARSDDDEKAKKARAEMNGTWIPSEAELDGEKLPEEFLKSIRLVVKEEKYTATVGDQIDEGTVTLDLESDPKGMEIKGSKGPNDGKTIPAIYELKDDVLKVCYNLEGKKRPTKFKTTAGSKLYLVTYKKNKT